jgi:hypothetical protein
VRGTPWGSAVRSIRNRDDYTTAELVRKKTKAGIGGRNCAKVRTFRALHSI